MCFVGARNKKQIASHSCWPVNTVWRKLLYSGFHAHKAVCGLSWTYSKATWFGPRIQGAGIRYQNTSHIQILLASHFETRGSDDIIYIYIYI